jgi:hypothetical protein
MNVELLREVQKRILQEPEKFDMSDFEGQNSCGTTYCIGGWVCVVGESSEFSSLAASKLLDLLPGQSERLFFGNVEGFTSLWDTPTDRESAIRIAGEAVRRIDLFIDSNGNK